MKPSSKIVHLTSKPPTSRRVFWSVIVGNVLDHYDSALYAFLAPFLAPIFFPESDPLVALIMIYGLKSLSMITRPFGSILFGHLALRYPTKTLLVITLTGVAICTLLIGIIPGYETIGILAPISLAVIRAIQGIFAAGEHNIAALFILEHVKNKKKHSIASSYYLCSTMSGTMLASLAATIVSQTTDPTYYWRIAFIIGIFTCLVGIYLRIKTDYNEKLTTKIIPKSSFKLILENKLTLIKIIPISSFTFVTYIVPFIFLNNFIPLFGKITTSELLVHNTILLVVDIIMLPIFGFIAAKFDIAKWMATMSCLLAVSIIPSFYILPSLSIIGVTMVKMWIITLGIAFVAPLNALLFRMIPGREKYLVTGFGYAIGTELLGRSTTPICLGLWYFTDNVMAPAAYIAFVAICATFALLCEINNSTERAKKVLQHR